MILVKERVTVGDLEFAGTKRVDPLTKIEVDVVELTVDDRDTLFIDPLDLRLPKEKIEEAEIPVEIPFEETIEILEEAPLVEIADEKPVEAPKPAPKKRGPKPKNR